MTSPEISEYATEGFGWKVLLSGFFTGTTGWIVEIDWVAVIGVVVLVGGFVLQLLGYLRKRDEYRTNRQLQVEKHEIEMAILRERLADLRTDGH